MSKKIILSGYFGFKNFGDEAILSVLLDKLQSIDSDVTVITSDPEYTKSLHKKINCVKTFDFFNIAAKMIRTDTLVSGGGSLLQDVTSVKSLFYYLMIIFMGLFFNKKVIIFAQGIGPINSKIGQFFTKTLLKRCSFVTVRDVGSAELLAKWDVKSHLVCDPIFSVPVNKSEKSKKIGIQLRAFVGVNDAFLAKLAHEIAANFSGYEIEIYSLQDDIDFDVCSKLRDILLSYDNSLKVDLKSQMSYQDVINSINSCEYLISMRFHAIVIGLLTGVKTLPVNYDIKVEKLANEFNLPILNFQYEFDNQIKLLKNQDLCLIGEKLRDYKFNWDDIMAAITK